MATVSYTYDLKCNGGNVSQVKINGTDVKRVKVNGNDVIHKFVKYTTTVTLNCYIRFDEITKTGTYNVCGETYISYKCNGQILVGYSTSGDSMSDSGAEVPAVELYFRRYAICEEHFSDLELHHKTFSDITPGELGWYPTGIGGAPLYPVGTTVYEFSREYTDFSEESCAYFSDYYKNGSNLRTPWGNVNISASHDIPDFTGTSVEYKYVLLGSISKTFTRAVQEY